MSHNARTLSVTQCKKTLSVTKCKNYICHTAQELYMQTVWRVINIQHKLWSPKFSTYNKSPGVPTFHYAAQILVSQLFNMQQMSWCPNFPLYSKTSSVPSFHYTAKIMVSRLSTLQQKCWCPNFLLYSKHSDLPTFQYSVKVLVSQLSIYNTSRSLPTIQYTTIVFQVIDTNPCYCQLRFSATFVSSSWIIGQNQQT